MTEDDLELARRRTLVRQRRAIMRIRESSRARLLEKLRVTRRPTRVGTVVVIPTTELVRPKSLTPALTGHHRAFPWRRPELQSRRTRGEKVGPTSHDGTNAFTLVRGHRHGEVKPVHEGDGVGGEVGVAVVEVELRQGDGGGASSPVALEAAAAVTGGAGESVVRIVAPGTGPDAAGPEGGRGGEGTVGEGVEGEATALEDLVARVGLYGRPDSEGAVVDDGQNELGVCSGSKGAQDKEERGSE